MLIKFTMPDSITYASRLTVSLDTVANIDTALAQVAALEKFSSSIFLTRTWMASWLQTLKNKADIFCIRFYHQQKTPVGICFITRSTIRRRKFFSIDQLSLNESEDRGNKFIIEYNGILHNPEFSADIHYSLIEFLARSGLEFDEFRINAAESSAFPTLPELCKTFGLKLIEDNASKAYYTNLAGFGGDPEQYLASLSKNKREQIRRSLKYYSQFGHPAVKFAAHPSESLEIFQQLGELHQQSWNARGNAGLFTNSAWVDFHTEIITRHPDKVQLIRISSGSHVLGCLYNLIDRNIAYSIQSGFNYSDDKNDRPGIISHYLVTHSYIKNAVHRYEYLAGESQYKRSLSNGHSRFHWYLVQRKKPKMHFENALVGLKRIITNE